MSPMPNDIQLSIEFGVKILEDIVAAGYDFLKTEQKKRDLFGKATERYVKGLIERFGEVKVLGMNRPVPLLSLYVTLRCYYRFRNYKPGYG